MLKIYNTLTKKKELFKPLNPNKVGLYVCGMTVYDLSHIGHARVLVAFDVVVRYLKNQGYEVNYVRNITDIDDKIIKRAAEKNEAFHVLTERMIEAMHQDFSQLDILLPTHEPRATESISQMIELIQLLIEKGMAYRADNGDIIYQVNQFKSYGQLAHQDLEKLRRGSRITIELSKKDPLDFVLWKQAKSDEPSWDSPWGKGRPGWHIECSAMSMAALGNHFDIHGGGLDLVFPHHQNEIAQSEGATNKKFVNTWMHVGFVQINHQKMSKSLGNFFTVRDVLKNYSAEVVRYFLMASHYRSPIHYSQENLQAAHAALQRFYNALRGFNLQKNIESENKLVETYQSNFNIAMDDDFNTPDALAVLFDVVRDINKSRKTDLNKAIVLANFLKKQASILGFLQQEPEQYLKAGLHSDQAQVIEKLIHARNKARAEKNWDEADRIRVKLNDLGVSVNDNSSGSEWHFY